MNKDINCKVFVGGSESIGRLPDKVISYLESLLAQEAPLIVGDGYGIELAAQNYFHAKGYRNVTVYHQGESCRYNVGEWEKRYIPPSQYVSDHKLQTPAITAMINDCDCALIAWDAHSQNVQSYICELRKTGKALFIYREDIDSIRVIRKKHTLKSERR